MDENKKMKILVIGTSGAGKSTLIKNVSGKDVKTGTGEAVTKETTPYDCEIWPFQLIDTQGFEYKSLKQVKSVLQVINYIKKTNGIDAVWYCVDSETKRVDTHNIDLLSKSIKGWNNMPLFVVLTKSYSKYDIEENINSVKKGFEKTKITNIKEIIPVVAEERILNEETKIESYGIEDLCIKTLECFDESKELIEIKVKKKETNKKRIISQAITIASTASAFTIGTVPLNFADAALLVPLELTMTKALFWNYGIKNNNLVAAIGGSQAITLAAKQVVSAVKAIPGVGDIANGVVAGVIVFVLGEAVTAISEGITNGKYNEDDIDKIVADIGKNVNENPLLNKTIKYFEKNIDKTKGKKQKEIFEEIINSKEI